MNGPQLDALVASAREGITFDGLTLSGEGPYEITIPGESTEVNEEELRAFATENPWFVSNWYYFTRTVGSPESARYDFLRWLEDADEKSVSERYEALFSGISQTWGQLQLTTTLAEDGKRRYSLRHIEDASEEDLDSYDNPLNARELVKEDDGGRYRPLSTAPTLPTGWKFTDLDGRDLVQTVDFIYPATIANWHREREGELDVTHFREAAERQSGIYEIVSQLSAEELEAATEACCVDSQCLKRRMWDKDEGTELETDRGNGEFPCREPCSLFITAARKFVTLGREDTRSYEFELTPTEKEQIEEIIAAVADGRTEDIREADLNEAANRYRARYLRAQRMNEDGLSGTPTYPDDLEL